MLRTQLDRGVALAGAVVLVLMALGLIAAQMITTRAFSSLEAEQTAKDATRVRIGLDSWVSLLRSYGATNSV